MSPRRCYRALLRLYPRTFRQRFAGDLEELFLDLYRTRAAGLPRGGRVRFWWRRAIRGSSTTALILGTVALIAAWLPTRRAASVDPGLTLRAE